MKMLKVKLKKLLVILVFASLFFAAPNQGYCDNDPQVGVAKEAAETMPDPINSKKHSKYIFYTIALLSLFLGIYILVQSLKKDSEKTLDFDETLPKNNDLRTPENVNEAINSFLKKVK